MDADKETFELEASVLSRLYVERLTGQMSQAEFGERFKIGTQGMVSQYLTGRRPLNLPAAVAFSRGLGVPIREFSPRIADQIQEAIPHSGITYSAATEESANVLKMLDSASEPERLRIFSILKLAFGQSISDAEVESRMPVTRGIKDSRKKA